MLFEDLLNVLRQLPATSSGSLPKRPLFVRAKFDEDGHEGSRFDGGSTAIDPHDDEVLLKKWEKSDLWPVVREQATSIISRDEEPRMFNNFCPETAYDRFGLFATDLYHYTDEIDIDVAHTRLGRERAGGEDWQWTWESIHPMHYTECPLYSLLLAAPGTEHRSSESGSSSPVKILDLRPSFHGLSINLNALVDRVRRWWTSRK